MVDETPFTNVNLNATFETARSADAAETEHRGAWPLTYAACYDIAGGSIVSPFVDVRVSQWAAHARRRKDRFDIGAEIRLRDPNQKATKASKAMVGEIWKTLERYRPLFENVSGMARDAFCVDQFNAEVIYTKGRKPFGFEAMDAATTRFGKPSPEEIRSGRVDPNTRGTVQIDENGKKVRDWDPGRVLWGKRRPRTGALYNGIGGHGYPEIVEALDIIQDLYAGKNYNSSFFRNGVRIGTMLIMKAKMPPKMAAAFQRRFMSKLVGESQAHRMAMLVLNPGGPDSGAESIEKLDLSQSNKDMEFMHAFAFNYKILAACFGMDLDEVGLGDPTNMKPASLNERGPMESILLSRERGLRPSLRALEAAFDRYIIHPYDADFQISFLGMDSITPAALADLRSKELKAGYVTLNEIRAEDDKPLIDHPAADLPLSTEFIQLYQFIEGQKQAEQAGDEGDGGPGLDGFDGGDDGEVTADDKIAARGAATTSNDADIDFSDPDQWTAQVAKTVAKGLSSGRVRDLRRSAPALSGRRKAGILLPGRRPHTWDLVDSE